MQMKAFGIAALAAAGFAVAGCSTGAATDVTAVSATLNGRLINPLEDQTLDYHFEYVPTAGDYDSSRSTPTQTLPAGAGWTDVKAAVPGRAGEVLYSGTEYKYRLCGEFKPSGRAGCLPEKTFTTPLDTPEGFNDVRIMVKTASNPSLWFAPLQVTARSLADGTLGGGLVQGYGFVGADRFTFVNPSIPCARISGRSAVVNFGANGGRITAFATDGGSTAKDTLVVSTSAVYPGRAATDCGPKKDGEPVLPQTITAGRVIIGNG